MLRGSRPIRGSPFLCQVYDASKVKIENIPNSTVSVNDNILFKCKYIRICIGAIFCGGHVSKASIGLGAYR